MTAPKDILCGTTRVMTWVNSGITPTGLSVSVLAGSSTLVSSAAMTSSGNGHYYQPVTLPTTPGFYVVRWQATIGGKPYKNEVRIRTILGEVA